MELELGLRFSRELRNPTFASAESDAAFVVVGHIPGIRLEDVEVCINEQGNAITVAVGGGQIFSFEAVIGGRVRLTSQEETRPFLKVFRIPSGVALDRIDASFHEEYDALVILMPKVSIGGEASGAAIQENIEKDQNAEEDEEISLEQPQELDGDTKTPDQETPIKEPPEGEKSSEIEQEPEQQQTEIVTPIDEIEPEEEKRVPLDREPPQIEFTQIAEEEHNQPIEKPEPDQEQLALPLETVDEEEVVEPTPIEAPELDLEEEEDDDNHEVESESSPIEAPRLNREEEEEKSESTPIEPPQLEEEEEGEEEEQEEEEEEEEEEEDLNVRGGNGEKSSSQPKWKRKKKREKGRSGLRPGILMGSALLLSLVVLVVNLLRNRRRQSQ